MKRLMITTAALSAFVMSAQAQYHPDFDMIYSLGQIIYFNNNCKPAKPLSLESALMARTMVATWPKSEVLAAGAIINQEVASKGQAKVCETLGRTIPTQIDKMNTTTQGLRP